MLRSLNSQSQAMSINVGSHDVAGKCSYLIGHGLYLHLVAVVSRVRTKTSESKIYIRGISSLFH